MKNIKFISIFSACGFIFSFICGLFSKSKIYIILIKALIFALVFALLALLISFLYEKFLYEETSDFSSGNNDSTAGQKSETKGTHVDFVVRDEEFEKGDSENHFVVGDKHQMLQNSDLVSSGYSGNPVFSSKPLTSVTGSSNVSDNNSTNGTLDSAATNDKFVPLRNTETVENFTSKEALSNSNNDTVSSNYASTAERNFSDNIDTLPDMNGLSFATESNSSGDESIIEDTDTSFSSSVSHRSSNSEPPEVKDASLMAKAISSILSDEN